jgi:hypothetical protein
VAEKKINGRTFSVGQVLATKSMVLKARLAKTAAPVFAALPEALGSLGKGEEEKEAAGVKLISALSELFGKGDPEVIATLFKDICELASIRRDSGSVDPVDFDGDLTGHDADIIPLVAFVLTEQFGDFLSGFRGIGSLGKLLKKA